MAQDQVHPIDDKHPTLGPQDEDAISRGIKKAETGIDSDHDSSPEDHDEKEILKDSSQFHPNRILYILKHNLFSKEVNIVDITSSFSSSYSGGDIMDELRDAARAMAEDSSSAKNPTYRLTAKHWYSSKRAMIDVPSSTELAAWKHGAASFSDAQLTFPSKSAHSAHTITMAQSKWYKRTNEWVQDSITYSWSCDSKRKANRMTLFKKVGAKQMVVARYAQRWGSWITGGVLLIDGKEVDEVVAVLTACVMLRRMQQRAAERVSVAGGGGGGGGGE